MLELSVFIFMIALGIGGVIGIGYVIYKLLS